MATWYVRPDTTHSTTRNGTSYSTAWGGWSEITWGVGGVSGGDTIYVCGSHAYSAASITVGAHGGTNESTRCIIRGDYPTDSGNITFTGARYLENSRAWTTITELTITAGTSNCLFVSGGTDCVYSNNTLVSSNSAPMSLWDGASFSRVTISGNTFRGASTTSGSGGTLTWFVTTAAALKTLTTITISDNIFEDCSAGRSVIHFRTENDTDPGSIMTGIVVSGNIFRRCRGVLVEIVHGHATSNLGGTLTVTNNRAYSCDEATLTAGIGGFLSIAGFSNAQIYKNIAYNVRGAAGFCNAFYGTFNVYDNFCDGLSTSTIDAVGILFDHGATNSTARGNTFKNLTGKSGVDNSGVGFMVLDSTNITISGNIVDGCRWGIHLGAAATGQSCIVVNNTFTNCTQGAIFTTATADLANCEVKNNLFVGSGYTVYDQTATVWSDENYNCFYGFSTGTSNHTLGAQSITSNPVLDTEYKPLESSPCINAGILIDGVVLKDFYGKDITYAPDIGAKQSYSARTRVGRAI